MKPQLKAWTAKTIALLGTIPDRELAQHIGCKCHVVSAKRRQLAIKAYGKRYRWGATEVALFRIYSDKAIAKLTGRSIEEVAA